VQSNTAVCNILQHKACYFEVGGYSDGTFKWHIQRSPCF